MILLRTYAIFVYLFIVNAFVCSQFNNLHQLSAKKYNEIAFLTTHNAFNSAYDDFVYPNQNFGITRQLVDGVRCLMIDVYSENGECYVYHGNSILGKRSLQKYLVEVYDFLNHNPLEVVTIIFESYVSANQIQTALDRSGLLLMAYAKSEGSSWHTLQQMVESGRRLVVFSDKNDASSTQKWYHYIWKYAVETSFEVTDVTGFTLDYNRGNAKNDFLILNHFVVGKLLGTGERSSAKIVNSKSFLGARVDRCKLEKSRFPNFIAVDFYDFGDCLSVVNRLNGVSDSVFEVFDASLRPLFYPNPVVSSKVSVKMPRSARVPLDVTMFSSNGQYLASFNRKWEREFVLEVLDYPQGLYFLRIVDINGQSFTLKLLFK